MAVQDSRKVGVFWMVHGELIADAVPIEEGETYGAAIQHGGHWEYWLRLEPLTHAQYLLKSQEYDRFPRGRVVYFPKSKRFVVYADRCVWTPQAQRAVQEGFGLRYPIRFTSDSHYRCADCGGPAI